ncbi:hypothetical protein [Anaerobutyricum hallii]
MAKIREVIEKFSGKGKENFEKVFWLNIIAKRKISSMIGCKKKFMIC